MHTIVPVALVGILSAPAVAGIACLIYGCLYLIRCVNIARRVTRGRRLQRAH